MEFETADYVAGFGPATGFATLQGVNVFSLEILLMPLNVLPAWSFVVIVFACGLVAFSMAARIYRAHPSHQKYAKNMKATVPRLREFPFVYSYMFGTLVLFFLCAYVAMRHVP